MRGHTRGLARGGRGQEDRALQAEEMTPEDQSPVANVEGRGGAVLSWVETELLKRSLRSNMWGLIPCDLYPYKKSTVRQRRKKTSGGHGEEAAVCKLTREASEETRSADSFILDL